ncbi:transposase [Propioniciclava sp. MC1595]|uniref:transposase n=1 Tax=Propioniciclava sp. MC1595 TaxID=2760308 RepID=UPI00166252BA|nr:transposase [Propioniciclava sp. MC1595]MBB1495883.1 transposase [Propioniciclava sp. MC1595]QTE24599.1 transposase [Propioniciclava sp. MC1595]
MRESVRIVLQELIGADRYERTPERTNERNGTRPKEVMTKGGTVEVQIPKLGTAARLGDNRSVGPCG